MAIRKDKGSSSGDTNHRRNQHPQGGHSDRSYHGCSASIQSQHCPLCSSWQMPDLDYLSIGFILGTLCSAFELIIADRFSKEIAEIIEGYRRKNKENFLLDAENPNEFKYLEDEQK